jgi:putative transposase
VLLDAKITISMDGKGTWRDNVFVERLWRSVKYQEVYLRAYDSVSEARDDRHGIAKKRPRSRVPAPHDSSSPAPPRE